MEMCTSAIPGCLNQSTHRRTVLKKLAQISGIVSAAFLVWPLTKKNAMASTIAPDDERLFTENITYPGETCDMMAYLARPKDERKYPAVIVVHENRGLNDHIRDVTRRMALEGFLTIAPDALSPIGGTPDDPDRARDLLREQDYTATVKNFVAAVKYLKTHPNSTGKVGITGFCWGGAMTNQAAVNAPDLVAAVPYYGMPPDSKDVPKIKASMLLHYAGNDTRINAGIPEFEKALKEAGVEYEIYIYEGADHAFNNDTNESRYNKEAATLAWKRTVEFFRKKLT